MTPERRKEIKAKYRQTHREQIRTASKEYQAKIRREHPERIKEISASFRSRHQERLTENERRRRLDNPEAIRAACKKWRLKNLEEERARGRLYAKLHPEHNREAARRRRARELKAEGSHTRAELAALMERQGNRCADCKRRFSAVAPATLDHITPLSKGGSEFIQNLRWVCGPCNSEKYNKSPEEWARLKGVLFC